tara:strand:- start:289430 stop:291757 length:2328 start_codon:yes stop_codon:yes gene_type:complete
VKLRSVLTVIIWAAAISCVGLLLFFFVQPTSDLTLFFSADRSAKSESIINDLRSGANAKIIIIGLEGTTTNKLSEASNKLAKALRKSRRFEFILNGSSLGPNNLEKLFKWRYLLSPRIESGRFSAQKLRFELEERLDELSSLTGVLEGQYIRSDPTAEFRAISKNLQGNLQRKTKHGVWFSRDEQQALMLLYTNVSPHAIDEQDELTALIKETFNEINNSGEIIISLTGQGVFSVESRALIKAEAQRVTVMASTVVCIFLLVVFRSFISVALTLLPLFTGIVFAVAAVQILFGYVHGITIAFGATIIGVAVDYPIHVMSHKVKKEKASGTVCRIGRTMIIGAITTSIGYAAMAFSGFVGLSQLGVFSIIGTLTAMITARYVLPMAVADDFSIPSQIFHVPKIRFITGNVYSTVTMFVVLTILSTAFLFWGSSEIWNDDLSKLNMVSKSSRKLNKTLRNELNLPDPLRFMAVKGDNTEEVLQTSEVLAESLNQLVVQRFLGGYDMAARYLPSVKTQRFRQESIPDEKSLRENIDLALVGLKFKRDAFGPFIRDAVAASSSSRHVYVEDMQGTIVELKLSLLLKEVKGESVALIPLYNVGNENALHEVAKSTYIHGVRYINAKRESTKLITKYRNEALAVCLLGSLAIIVALIIFLGSIQSVGRVVLSVAGPIVILIFILSRLEDGLSIFHLVSTLLVAGLGIDYALFLNRHFDTIEERDRALNSVLICSISTTLVFGILSVSDLYVLSSIGTTVFFGTLLCIVFSFGMKRDRIGTC